MLEFSCLLVPVDFSAASKAAFAHALSVASGENPFVVLVHVIDSSLVGFAASHALGSDEALRSAMRAQAEAQWAEYQALASAHVDVQTIICEGVPFLEIIRKAQEFQVDAIVMSKHGIRGGYDKLLFGSTAEKVLRGATRPVIVVPHDE